VKIQLNNVAKALDERNKKYQLAKANCNSKDKKIFTKLISHIAVHFKRTALRKKDNIAVSFS
jgi:hypothetical protein